MARFVFATLFFFFSIPALACMQSWDPNRIVCPGDKAFSPKGTPGSILGVNGNNGKVVLDIEGDFTNYTYEIKDIFLSYGCVHNYCVGDKAYSPNNIPGKVVGVNPHKGMVALDLEGYFENYPYSIKDTFLGVGCISGVCVKDFVVNPNGVTGEVSGVNIYNGKISVDLDGYFENFSYAADTVFVRNYCVDYDQSVRANLLASWMDSYNFTQSRGHLASRRGPIVVPTAEPQHQVVIIPQTQERPASVIVQRPMQPSIPQPSYSRNQWRRRGGNDYDRHNAPPVKRVTLVDVRCSSDGYDLAKDFFGNRPQRKTCDAGAPIIGIREIRQESVTPCNDRTVKWTPGASTFTVERGCRANFILELAR